MILEVLKELNDDRIKILVVGKPDDEKSILNLKKCSNKNLKCIFDFVTSEQLEKYLKSSDIALLTHKKIWTSGIAILAGNLEIPLVGKLPKIFEDYNYSELGYFLEEGYELNSENLTQLIRKAIIDGKEKRELKARRLKELLDENNDEKIGKLYFDFYNKLFD